MEQKKAVGIWIRVSSDDQAKGDSPEHHERRARQYAETKGWEVVTVYHLEAMTGKSVIAYPETKRMLRDLRAGVITGLIFSKLARFARNTKELLEFADIFNAENADLVSLQEAIDTSTPAGRLFYTMIAAMAQWEREEIASRVAASVPIRAQLGKSLGGTPALGYKWVNKELVIDEKYAPIRKLIYEQFLKLRRKTAVAAYLNKNGYRTPKGQLFTDTTIKQLLRDPTAKGERRVNYSQRLPDKKYNKLKPVSEWVVHPCPAIVSEELWDECNRILDDSLVKNKKPGPRPKHLLAGYVYCHDCDKKMYVFHQTKNTSYRCQTCGNRISTEDLEEIFRSQLKSFLLTETSTKEFLEKIENELEEKQKLLEIVIEEKRNLAGKIDRLIDLRTNNELTKELFLEKFKPLEERSLQLSNQIPEIEAHIDYLKIQYNSSDIILHDAKDLYTQWESYTYEEKRGVIEDITEHVRVGKLDIYVKLSSLPPSPHTANPTQKQQLQSENPVKTQSNLYSV